MNAEQFFRKQREGCFTHVWITCLTRPQTSLCLAFHTCSGFILPFDTQFEEDLLVVNDKGNPDNTWLPVQAWLVTNQGDIACS